MIVLPVTLTRGPPSAGPPPEAGAGWTLIGSLGMVAALPGVLGPRHRLRQLTEPDSVSRDRGRHPGQELLVVDQVDQRVRIADAAHPGEDVPRPPYWGGYVLEPGAIEFWQAGEFRLHDRLVYVRAPQAPGGWDVQRLSP